MNGRILAATLALAVSGGAARAEHDPDYEALMEPLGGIMGSCLEASADGDGDLACLAPMHEACEARGPAGGTTYGLAACAEVLFRLWDDELNRVWPEVLAWMDAPEAEYLREEQRAWIAYKEAACDFESAQVWGGSMLAYVGGECRARMTAERVAQLRDYIRYP
jgi:uncharacterized protein YecT (DUF1311 family)